MSKRSVLSAGAKGSFRLLAVAALFLAVICASTDAQPSHDVRVTIAEVFQTPLGDWFDVEVSFENLSPDREFGGFDLLIQYDSAALIFSEAIPGQLLTDCGWEYFEFAAAEEGKLRLVAVADLDNGPAHPDCYLSQASGVLVTLTFFATLNPDYQCTTVPLRFVWTDCSDNLFANLPGDSTFFSAHVYDPIYGRYIEANDTLPTIHGAPDACLIPGSEAARLIDYSNGLVVISCDYPHVYRGDVNVNAIPYEIADWLIFQDYFLEGLAAFEIDLEPQIAATDCNADGLVLTLRDLIYLYRVIIGDAIPYPLRPADPGAIASFMQDTVRQIVSVDYPDTLAATWLTFSGTIVPETLIPQMTCRYSHSGGNTHVLVYPAIFERTGLVTGEVLRYTGDGILGSVEVADNNDAVIATAIEIGGEPTIKIEVGDFAFSPTDTQFQVPVFIENVADTVAAYVIDLAIANPAFWRFDLADPIDSLGEIISNWGTPGVGDLGLEGQQIRVVGGTITEDPIDPASEFRHLFTLNAIPTDVMDDSLCGFAGTVEVSHLDFSDPWGVLLDGWGYDGEYAIACDWPCGDVNLDEVVNISDAVAIICWIFGVCDSPALLDICDVNCDELVNISDVVYLISYIFAGGATPCAGCPLD